MSAAYATKDQMKVWKSTSKPDKDFPDRPSEKVMYVVQDTDNGPVAYLVASDGYQLVKRNLQTEADAKTEAPIRLAIPRDAIEQAEKAMKGKDRAHFEENKITVVEVAEDEETGIESIRVKAIVPYQIQTDMFLDLESALEKHTNGELPEKSLVVNARILKKVVDQLKAGDEEVFLTIRFRGGEDPLIMTAFDDMDYMEITAAVMPIKS